MTCTHQWADATTKAGPEWTCAKCGVEYSKIKNTPLAQPAVPDALTRDDGESPEYTSGWNDCRQLMLEILREKNTWVGLTRWEIDAKMKEKNEM